MSFLNPMISSTVHVGLTVSNLASWVSVLSLTSRVVNRVAQKFFQSSYLQESFLKLLDKAPDLVRNWAPLLSWKVASVSYVVTLFISSYPVFFSGYDYKGKYIPSTLEKKFGRPPKFFDDLYGMTNPWLPYVIIYKNYDIFWFL